jgi:thioredoxin-related protein
MENNSPRPAAKWLEIAANVSIIIVAAVIVIVFAQHYFLASKKSPLTIAAGAKLTGQPVNWQDSSKNVVLLLSTTCRFCKESSGFYRRLAEDCRGHARMIAFFPQTAQEAQAYLKAEDVQVDEIKHANFQSLQVGGTPTLLLVDSKGVVQKVWLGKLPEVKEKEVLNQSCQAEVK